MVTLLCWCSHLTERNTGSPWYLRIGWNLQGVRVLVCRNLFGSHAGLLRIPPGDNQKLLSVCIVDFQLCPRGVLRYGEAACDLPMSQNISRCNQKSPMQAGNGFQVWPEVANAKWLLVGPLYWKGNSVFKKDNYAFSSIPWNMWPLHIFKSIMLVFHIITPKWLTHCLDKRNLYPVSFHYMSFKWPSC